MIETPPLSQSRLDSPESNLGGAERTLESSPSVERRQAAFRFRLSAYVRIPGQPYPGTSVTRSTAGGESTATGSNSSSPFRAKG